MVSRRAILLSAAAVPPLRLPKKVRVAIIGLEGHIGEIISPLEQLPDVELAAYSSAVPVTSGRLERVKHYPRYQEMLDQEKLDVVAVTPDDGARASSILACLDRKLHVVAEKPLAISRKDYEAVKKRVLETGVGFSMLLPLRFTPHFLALKQVVASGEIGEVSLISGQKSYRPGISSAWRNRKETYSGTIPWVGIHMADLMLWIGNHNFVECASFQTRIGWPQLGPRENAAAILFRMDNGGSATLTMDYLRPEFAESHEDDRLRLAGTEGVAEYQRSTGVTVVTTKAKRRQVPPSPPQSLFVNFLDSVYNGKPTMLPLNEIWRANEVCLAARDAANSSKVIRL